VVFSGSYAYVIDGDTFKIVDMSDPSNPLEIGHYSTPSWCSKVVVSHPYAYLESDHAIWILDVSTPSAPVKVGAYFAPYYIHDMAVSEPYLYVAGGEGGLIVVDISDPANPVEVRHHDMIAFGLTIHGPYCYIAAGNLGIRIIKISQLIGEDEK